MIRSIEIHPSALAVMSKHASLELTGDAAAQMLYEMFLANDWPEGASPDGILELRGNAIEYGNVIQAFVVRGTAAVEMVEGERVVTGATWEVSDSETDLPLTRDFIAAYPMSIIQDQPEDPTEG